MATSISSTALDFNNIKAALIEHLQSQTEFTDYDFEASALSTIMDILSYNTHYNGLIANFAINESFLNTAQLRSSMLAHAQNLGYDVRSKSSATAYVNLDVTGVSVADRTPSVSLPIGTKFSASVNGNTYVFETREIATATDDGSGNYSFEINDSTSIPIYQGTQKTKTFYAGSQQDENLYIIPDVNMDTSTVIVDVYDSRSSSSYTTYTNLNTAISLSSTSTHYILREAPNGYYELSFGDGLMTGKAPVTGNMIVVNYLNTVGASANGGSSFTPLNSITIGNSTYSIITSTVSNSAGGAVKETIASIRKNAPAAFATQNRLVTAEDYRATILNKYSAALDDVVAWGGEDHVPKTYGKVFVSLKFPTGTSDATKTSTKAAISTNITTPLSIMSIDTEFIDPEEVYLETTTTFNFNPNKSRLSVGSTKSLVQNTISDYFDTNLSSFSSVFRRSQILAEIDDLDDAILNSRMDVKVQRRFEPTLSTSLAYSIDFPIALAVKDKEEYIITSSKFTISGDATCYFRNKLDSYTIEIVNGAGDIISTNIGSYDPTEGTIDLNGFAPTALYLSRSYIKVHAKPANQSTIRPLRNYTIELDDEETYSTANIDYEEIQTTL